MENEQAIAGFMKALEDEGYAVGDCCVACSSGRNSWP